MAQNVANFGVTPRGSQVSPFVENVNVASFANTDGTRIGPSRYPKRSEGRKSLHEMLQALRLRSAATFGCTFRASKAGRLRRLGNSEQAMTQVFSFRQLA